jgi:hypothetical protein
MTTTARYLVDTSAIVQLPRVEVAAVLGPLLISGQLATCGVIDLKLHALVRSHSDLVHVRAIRAAAFHWLPTIDADLTRALQTSRPPDRWGTCSSSPSDRPLSRPPPPGGATPIRASSPSSRR